MEERGQRESCAYVMWKNRDKKYKRATLFLEAQLVFCTGRIVESSISVFRKHEFSVGNSP